MKALLWAAGITGVLALAVVVLRQVPAHHQAACIMVGIAAGALSLLAYTLRR